jgi:hypothetical protein
MGWEERRGGPAYYCSVRIDGRPRKIYLGKGEAAEAQAARVAQAREERRSEYDAWQCELTRLAAAEEALRELRAWADVLVRAAFLTAGLHEHRGQWRKRRTKRRIPMTMAMISPELKQGGTKSEPKQEAGRRAPEASEVRAKTPPKKQPYAARPPSLTPPPDPTPPVLLTRAQAFEELVRRANEGNAASLDGLREILDKNPAIWRRAGDVSALAERSWTELLANGNKLAEESIRRRLAALKGELAGDHAAPLESLLIDVVGVCWLATNQAEIAAAGPAGGSLQQAQFRLRRAESAQRRLLNAAKTLAMLRALAPRGLRPTPAEVEPIARRN